MRAWWIVAALIFLAACTSQIQGVSPESRNPCETVECSNGNICVNGTCACPEGTKSCNSACIPNGCCTVNDCSLGMECENNACVKQKQTCDFLQTWNNQTRNCECSINAKYCAEQAACIPKTACCDDTACKGSYRCGATKQTVKICFKAVFEQCKTVLKGEETKFSLPEEHSVRIDRILENSTLVGYVDGKKVELPLDEAYQVNNSTILKAETIGTVGGVCKEQPR